MLSPLTNFSRPFLADWPFVTQLQAEASADVSEGGKSVPSTLVQVSRSIGAALNTLILLDCSAIIVLLSQTLDTFSSTRAIRLDGVQDPWPHDPNLRLIYFFIAISAITILVNMVTLVLLYFHRTALSPSAPEIISVITARVTFLLWFSGNIFEAWSGTMPEKDLLKWSCRRKGYLGDVIVSYSYMCEWQVVLTGLSHLRLADSVQVTVKYLAICNPLLELGFMLCLTIIWKQTRLSSKYSPGGSDEGR